MLYPVVVGAHNDLQVWHLIALEDWWLVQPVQVGVLADYCDVEGTFRLGLADHRIGCGNAMVVELKLAILVHSRDELAAMNGRQAACWHDESCMGKTTVVLIFRWWVT